jgi:hypothetical protein
MPDFHPISEVIYLFSPLFQPFLSLLIRIFCHFLQDIVPAPLARTISYNIAGPISALGYQSPTLAQLMSRYATSDPTLIVLYSEENFLPNGVPLPNSAHKSVSFPYQFLVLTGPWRRSGRQRLPRLEPSSNRTVQPLRERGLGKARLRRRPRSPSS